MLLLGSLSGAAASQVQIPLISDDPPAYEVVFDGIADAALRGLLEQSSLLVELQKEPAERDQLRRRAVEDLPRLQRALRSRGYYDAAITHSIADGPPLAVVLTVAPGPLYLLGAYEVVAEGCDSSDCAPVPGEGDLGLTLGEAAESADIVSAERQVLTWYRRRGHAFPQVDAAKVIVDHKLRGLFVRQTVRPGTRHRFGDAVIEGADGVVSHAYLRRLRSWTVGDGYDVRRLREYRSELEGTALFQAVEVDPVISDSDEEVVNVRVKVSPGKARSIGAGVGFQSDIGPGVNAFWRHRNILGSDEDLELRFSVSEPKQSLGGSFRKPAFLRRDQDLLASSALKREDTDAFESLGVDGQLGLERRVSATLRTGVSALAEISRIEDADGVEDLYLFGLPVVLTNDARDSALDPTTGWFGSIKGTPFTGVFGKPLGFGKVEISASYYYDGLPVEGLVAAVRGKVGGIFGEETDDIPATRRFYAGGGGSVRGYEFQSVGPLDGATDPLGGRSVLELGAELRFRVFGDFGIVPFIDAGTVSDNSVPDFGNDLLWAAGLGFRYYTTIGPARFDLAFPINRRRGIDDSFQFYLSLGQAF